MLSVELSSRILVFFESLVGRCVLTALLDVTLHIVLLVVLRDMCSCFLYGFSHRLLRKRLRGRRINADIEKDSAVVRCMWNVVIGGRRVPGHATVVLFHPSRERSHRL